MINLSEIIRQLDVDAAAIRILLQTISVEQAEWKPDPETWCLREVMEHVYNEERIDFRKHLKEMLSDPQQPWMRSPKEDYLSVETCSQALQGFLAERKDSIAWLKALKSPNWDVESKTTFSPGGEPFVLRAGDVLTSWVAHDFLHIRQFNELLFAWNKKQAAPYSVQYAGDW